ncbi:MAG: hypothetical protein AAB408_03400 [Patescibacteria group bacterium]
MNLVGDARDKRLDISSSGEERAFTATPGSSPVGFFLVAGFPLLLEFDPEPSLRDRQDDELRRIPDSPLLEHVCPVGFHRLHADTGAEIIGDLLVRFAEGDTNHDLHLSGTQIVESVGGHHTLQAQLLAVRQAVLYGHLYVGAQGQHFFAGDGLVAISVCVLVCDSVTHNILHGPCPLAQEALEPSSGKSGVRP